MKTENKYSYFILDLSIAEMDRDSESSENLENALDLILARMSSTEEPYKFFRNDKSRLLILFRTDSRKRRGQLVKLCEKNLLKEQRYETQGVSKKLFFNEIEQLQKNEEYKLIHSSNTQKEMYNYT